ncbi:MAG UNVERIFIED_CONTAM: hypothetical protein LVR18_50250 [Planctomycetaceae bacterium]
MVIDFSALPVGTRVQLLNLGPDEPYGGLDDMTSSDPETTGKVMEFRVAWDPASKTIKSPSVPTPPSITGSSGTPVSLLRLPALPPLPKSSFTRKVSLNELRLRSQR